MWSWIDPRSRSRSLTFWSSENCIFLRLPPPQFWRGAHSWWVTTIARDLVYSYSEPDFRISPPVGGHVTSKVVKCLYHQNPLCFVSLLAEARSLWLWLQVGRNRPCTLVAMTVSPLAGLFMAALWNRGAIIFLPCNFFLPFFFFSSPNLSGHRLDVYHTSTHGVALVRI